MNGYRSKKIFQISNLLVNEASSGWFQILSTRSLSLRFLGFCGEAQTWLSLRWYMWFSLSEKSNASVWKVNFSKKSSRLSAWHLFFISTDSIITTLQYTTLSHSRPMFDQLDKEKKLELSAPAEATLHLITKTKPFFPEYLTKMLCEEMGLQCGEDLFYKLLSTTVDHKLKNMLATMKEVEEGKLKTSDVEKYFEGEKIPISKAHFYPELGIEKPS